LHRSFGEEEISDISDVPAGSWGGVPNDLSSFLRWFVDGKALSMGRLRDHRRFHDDFFKNSLDKPGIH
jgi:hypothetical protein